MCLRIDLRAKRNRKLATESVKSSAIKFIVNERSKKWGMIKKALTFSFQIINTLKNYFSALEWRKVQITC